MSSSYSELIDKVIKWSNRDPDIFNTTNMTPDDPTSWTRANAGLVPDFLEYAADKAYRQLRIPATEFARDFCVEESDLIEDDAANIYGCTVQMRVPDDLIEVIFIRNKTKSYVFNEKIDMRTYYDRYSVKTSGQFWTRQGPVFRIFGMNLAVGDVLEIHYYRRLPALDTTWAVTAATYNTEPTLYTQGAAVHDTTTDDFSDDGSFIPRDNVDYTNTLWFFDNNVALSEPTGIAYDEPDGTLGEVWSGWDFSIATDAPAVPNWLRDENERILLFGALTELFAFVGEDDMQQKYGQMFIGEIQELNSAEVMRMASGGNVKINYNSYLI